MAAARAPPAASDSAAALKCVAAPSRPSRARSCARSRGEKSRRGASRASTPQRSNASRTRRPSADADSPLSAGTRHSLQPSCTATLSSELKCSSSRNSPSPSRRPVVSTKPTPTVRCPALVFTLTAISTALSAMSAERNSTSSKAPSLPGLAERVSSHSPLLVCAYISTQRSACSTSSSRSTRSSIFALTTQPASGAQPGALSVLSTAVVRKKRRAISSASSPCTV
mmetsp:Transcript_17656/g.54812  ORF Transcript_17656/g.54812 Transcript_17656/m.54812 type:complete len:226 (+) Transcript_17656:2070-2747(+)